MISHLSGAGRPGISRPLAAMKHPFAFVQVLIVNEI